MSYTVYGYFEDPSFATDNEYWRKIEECSSEDRANQRALQSPRDTVVFPSNVHVRPPACPECSGPVIEGNNMSGVKCSECSWRFCC